MILQTNKIDLEKTKVKYLINITLLLSLFYCNPVEKKQIRILTKDEFTSLFADSLVSKYEDIVIEEVGELYFKASLNDYEQKHFLGNAYSEYTSSPDSLESILNRYLVPYHTQLTGTDSINPSNIVPTIKDIQYIVEVEKTLDGKAFPFFYEKYNDDLIILYAEDFPDRITIPERDKIESLNITTDSLRALAIENLKSKLPSIERIGNKNFIGLVVGGNYEASLILFDELWTKDNFQVDGEIIIGVPARDLLMITGSNNTNGINRIKETIKEVQETGDHVISKHLFIRKDQKFEVYQ